MLKKILILCACLVAFSLSSHGKAKPFYQGEVISVEHAGGYTYAEIKEKSNKTLWIALKRIDLEKGKKVRFNKELVVKKFESKILKRVFKELMFASNLQYRIEAKK